MRSARRLNSPHIASAHSPAARTQINARVRHRADRRAAVCVERRKRAALRLDGRRETRQIGRSIRPKRLPKARAALKANVVDDFLFFDDMNERRNEIDELLNASQRVGQLTIRRRARRLDALKKVDGRQFSARFSPPPRCIRPQHRERANAKCREF